LRYDKTSEGASPYVASVEAVLASVSVDAILRVLIARELGRHSILKE
jgi:hypothetical protein